MFEQTKPYMLRRSSGEMQVVPYESEKETMRQDYDYVIESNISPANVSHVAFLVKNQARLNVYGEMFGGVSIEASSWVELKGTLHLAYWTEQGLAEESCPCSSMIEVTEGTVTVFICDYNHLVLMYDTESRYTFGLIHEGEEEVPASGSKSTDAAKTIERIAAHVHATSRGTSATTVPAKGHSPASSTKSNDTKGGGKSLGKSRRSIVDDVLGGLLKDRNEPTNKDSAPGKAYKGTGTEKGGNSNSSKKGTKGTSFSKRPPTEPNVKVTKSKFNVTQSVHSLSSSLSRTSREASRTKSSEKSSTPSRSPSRTPLITVVSSKTATTDADGRPSMATSHKSERSDSDKRRQLQARARTDVVHVLEEMRKNWETAVNTESGLETLKATLATAMEPLEKMLNCQADTVQQQFAGEMANIRQLVDSEQPLSAVQLKVLFKKVVALVKKLDHGS